MEGHDARVWSLPNDLLLSWSQPLSLNEDAATVQQLLTHGIVEELNIDAIKLHLQQHVEGRAKGGEAEIHFLRWHGPGCGSISEGDHVALKTYRRCSWLTGDFLRVESEADALAEYKHGKKALRKEVNLLSILHHSGFADRVPPVLGVVRHEGDVRDPPLHGYAMPFYRYGSLTSFIRNTCERRVPESTFGGFFSPPRLSGEFAALMATLERLHAGERGIMLQDISSNNLLIQEQADGSCRLLLADPSVALPISVLRSRCSTFAFVSTWLWGSLASSDGKFEPTADAYSLSFSFLELWMCAEGAPVPLCDVITMLRADRDKSQGRTFARELCVNMLKCNAWHADAIVPRIRRELPVSWLQLWLLLLGTEDFASEKAMFFLKLHRRPAEADLVQASAELAGVAADVEALGSGGLTAASLATPAGEALVGRCLRLHERLTTLSQLEPQEGSSLGPLDPSLAWVATRFMSQDHPLVTAMRAAQGEEPPGGRPALEDMPAELCSFRHAVLVAQKAAGLDYIAQAEAANAAKENADAAKQDALDARDKAIADRNKAFADCNFEKHMLVRMCQEYGRVRDAALALPLAQDQRNSLRHTGHLNPVLQQLISNLCPLYRAEPAYTAAGGPAGVTIPPALASQLSPPAGPPPAYQLAAQHTPISAQRVEALKAKLLELTAGLPVPLPAPAAGRPAPTSVSLDARLAGLQADGLAANQLNLAGFENQPAAAAALSSPPSNSPAAGQPLSSAPGPSVAVAAAPRSPAASPPSSFLQQPLLLPAAAGGAGTPSTDLSSHTAAGGSGGASPATSTGMSSPNKRKRGAEQRNASAAPGAILRFAASRDGCIAGLPAFRLPPRTNGSNPYAYMVAQLSERLRGDVHQLLAQRQGPYAALLEASGLPPAQLDCIVAESSSGNAYIEVSAASFLPGSSAGNHTVAAPIVFHSSSRNSGSYEQQVECGGGSAEQREQYSAVLQGHLKQCLAEGVTLAYGSGSAATVLFRIALMQLPQGDTAMPWVQWEWEVPAVDLAAVAQRASHLFKWKK